MNIQQKKNIATDNPSDSASKLCNPSGVDVSYSTRHVEESWHHLMKSEDTAKFKQIAVCNFDFLLASVSVCSFHLHFIFVFAFSNISVLFYMNTYHLMNWYQFRCRRSPFLIQLSQKQTERKKERPCRFVESRQIQYVNGNKDNGWQNTQREKHKDKILSSRISMRYESTLFLLSSLFAVRCAHCVAEK